VKKRKGADEVCEIVKGDDETEGAHYFFLNMVGFRNAFIKGDFETVADYCPVADEAKEEVREHAMKMKKNVAEAFLPEKHKYTEMGKNGTKELQSFLKTLRNEGVTREDLLEMKNDLEKRLAGIEYQLKRCDTEMDIAIYSYFEKKLSPAVPDTQDW
jgi:hypothetical protein